MAAGAGAHPLPRCRTGQTPPPATTRPGLPLPAGCRLCRPSSTRTVPGTLVRFFFLSPLWKTEELPEISDEGSADVTANIDSAGCEQAPAKATGLHDTENRAYLNRATA